MQFETLQERNERILSRFSVLDLRELSEDDLNRGEERIERSNPLTIIACGVESFIDWWRIESGGNVHEVRRFMNFCFCTCEDFFFTKTGCKHITFTTPATCGRCRRVVNDRGDLCPKCEADTAIYLKPQNAVEKIGGFRI